MATAPHNSRLEDKQRASSVKMFSAFDDSSTENFVSKLSPATVRPLSLNKPPSQAYMGNGRERRSFVPSEDDNLTQGIYTKVSAAVRENPLPWESSPARGIITIQTDIVMETKDESP
jgi:hypothetical protein